MPIDVSPIEDVEHGFLVTVKGTWVAREFLVMIGTLEELTPSYVIIDPTESIIPPGQRTPIDNANEGRKSVVTRIVKLLQDNPVMLYIMINRNDTLSLKTSMSLYEEAGIVDRYLFATSLEEALAIIEKHQSA